MAGRGMPADATEAVKWHIIAKAGGDNDPELDAFAAKQSRNARAAEKAAKTWLATATPRSHRLLAGRGARRGGPHCARPRPTHPLAGQEVPCSIPLCSTS